MTLEVIGSSVQGREIWLATITNQDLPGEKPKALFDGAMHGSEVIGSESMLHYINFLVTQYDSDETAREIVDKWITYVVPMVNPDGVENGKVSSDYRAARKNANLAIPERPETGVDLNRNLGPGSDPTTLQIFPEPQAATNLKFRKPVAHASGLFSL
jgi:murein tripeptide amidase MpaA